MGLLNLKFYKKKKVEFKGMICFNSNKSLDNKVCTWNYTVLLLYYLLFFFFCKINKLTYLNTI